MNLSNGNLVLANANSKRLVSPVYPSSIPIETAPVTGFPANSLLYADMDDFAPRVSFAYRPLNNDRTVVRGGYGIYYAPLTYTLTGNIGGGPFISSQSFVNSITNGVPSFAFPDPFFAAGGVGTQSVSPVIPTWQFPMTHQWNLTVERELPGSVVLQVDYRGEHTSEMPFIGDFNKPYPSTNAAGESFFRYSNFYSVNLIQYGAEDNLNALDINVSRQFANGLTFNSSYTYAKNLTDSSQEGEGIDNAIQNPYDRAAEYGNVDFMPTQRWVTYALYNLPFGRGQRFASSLPPVLNQVFGNWEVSGVLNFQTGQWLTPSFSGPDPSNTRSFGGRPDQIGSWQTSNPTISRWFNPAAFKIPGCPNATPVCTSPADVGRFGNAANSIIEAPGLSNFDFGLFKIKERYTLQVRATATDFFNNPNFGDPATNISSVNVGTITSLNGSGNTALGGNNARQIQLGLRLDF
jgi:hypothetical protein